MFEHDLKNTFANATLSMYKLWVVSNNGFILAEMIDILLKKEDYIKKTYKKHLQKSPMNENKDKTQVYEKKDKSQVYDTTNVHKQRNIP